MNEDRLSRDIENFLNVYKILAPEARAHFEAKLAPVLEQSDQRTRALYSALLSAAKEGLLPEEAITKMEQTNLKALRRSAPKK